MAALFEPNVILPPPSLQGTLSVEEAIARRRSVRRYRKEPLSLHELSQVLWAAQGITGSRYDLRAAPSAGATYPLELFVVAGSDSVGGLAAGVYQYKPEGHSLKKRLPTDLRQELAAAALGQRFIREAPVDLVLCADYRRTTRSYGQRGERYVHMEIGHAGQNVYLQAVALGLATVAVGAFDEPSVKATLHLEETETPLYIMPLGRPE